MNNSRKGKPLNKSSMRTPPAPAALCRAAQRIPEPMTHFAGLPIPDLSLPRGILLFARSRALLPDHKPTSHDRHVLLLCLLGAGVVLVNEQPIRLLPGQALVIFPGQVHHYADLEPGLLWLYATFEADRAEALLGLMGTPVPVPRSGWGLAADLVRLYGAAGRADALAPPRVAVTLWLLLLELVARAQPPWPRAVLAPADWRRSCEFVEKVQAYSLARVEAPVHVAEVARHLGMSRSKLYGMFREILGRGPGAYLRRQRVHHACSLLSATEESVSRVAERCGFSSLYAFSRTFKQVFGSSPSAYRASLRSRPQPCGAWRWGRCRQQGLAD